MARRGQHAPGAEDAQVEGTEPETGEAEGTEAEQTQVEGTEPEITEPETAEGEGVEPEELGDGDDDEDGAEDKVAETEDDEDEEEERPLKKKQPYVFTPFQGAKFVNALLEQEEVKNTDGSQKKVGSPMLYIYARNGRFGIRRSPIDIERKKKGELAKGRKPRWEIHPLSEFQEWAEEYVQNAKKGITAAQRRKQTREADEETAASTPDTGESEVAEMLRASLVRVGAPVEAEDETPGEQSEAQ
jgi:hypothetical protein